MLVVYVGVKYQDVRVGKWKGEAGKGEGPIVCVADQVPSVDTRGSTPWGPSAESWNDHAQKMGRLGRLFSTLPPFG